jgi:D-glycero-alpha-D-manno-heptose-7-phosphate kinase
MRVSEGRESSGRGGAVNIVTLLSSDLYSNRIAVAVGTRPAEHWAGSSIGVRARAPLRLGLAGGGTDLSPYCDECGGAVLNATIGRYAHAHLTFRDDHQLCFSAHDVKQEDIVPLAAELPLDSGLLLHRAVFNRMARQFLRGRLNAVTVTSTVDAPPGSGLGSSSALVVALVEAYRAAFSLPLGRYDVARLAFEIERIELGLDGGRQDQYAAAFGGLNFMEFLPGDKVIVNPLRIADSHLYEFEASLIVCFTGQSRTSDAIIKDQVAGIRRRDERAIDALHQLKADAVDMKQALLRGNIQEVAKVLERSWNAKRRTSEHVSNPRVQEVFDLGLKNGAVAGKVSGAGGGGFLMFMANPEQRYRLISALTEAGAAASPVQLSNGGAESWVTTR